MRPFSQPQSLPSSWSRRGDLRRRNRQSLLLPAARARAGGPLSLFFDARASLKPSALPCTFATRCSFAGFRFSLVSRTATACNSLAFAIVAYIHPYLLLRHAAAAPSRIITPPSNWLIYSLQSRNSGTKEAHPFACCRCGSTLASNALPIGPQCVTDVVVVVHHQLHASFGVSLASHTAALL